MYNVIGNTHTLSTYSSHFYFLYRELGCVPDIYSLIELSNHITPWNSKRRYDTIFYLACLERKPKASPDSSEIIKISVRPVMH